MGRGRVLGAGAVVGLLLASGCGDQSRVAPDQAVTVSGSVVRPDGEPAADRPVQLGVGVSVGDGAFAVLTLGLHCASGACSGAISDASTDEAGAYRFELEGRDTQSSFGEAESVLVTATGEAADGQVSGPLTSARFQVQTPDVRLPDLALVDPGLQVEDTGSVSARWEPVAPGPYTLRFEGDGAEPVWTVITGDPAAELDPRVLEDTAGRVVVSGGSEAAVEGSDVALTWRSAGVPYVSAAGAPASRGRLCRGVDASGATSEPAPCGLTDGALASVAVVPSPCPAGSQDPCPAATAAVIELGDAVPAELIVVRGCEAACAVDVSADGSTYRPVGSVSGDSGAVALDGTSVTSVRVSLGDGPAPLREVSVWGPAPATALAVVDDDARAEIAGPYGPEDGDGVPRGLAIVAAAAVVVALALASFALGRRRAATG